MGNELETRKEAYTNHQAFSFVRCRQHGEEQLHHFERRCRSKQAILCVPCDFPCDVAGSVFCIDHVSFVNVNPFGADRTLTRDLPTFGDGDLVVEFHVADVFNPFHSGLVYLLWVQFRTTDIVPSTDQLRMVFFNHCFKLIVDLHADALDVPLRGAVLQSGEQEAALPVRIDLFDNPPADCLA